MVRDDDNTATWQVCMKDEWLDVISPLHVQAIQLAPRNVQITTNKDGFLLTWEPPLTDDNIMSYEVACVEQSLHVGHVSIILDDKILSATLLFKMIPSGVTTDYQCCVKAYMKRFNGLKFTTESCLSVSGLPIEVILPSIPQTQSNSRILLLMLGVISGVLFVILVSTLVVFIIVCFRNKGDGSPKHKEDEVHISEKEEV